MTIDEYKNKIINRLTKTIKDRDYISKLDGDIIKSYNDSVKVSNLLGSNQISVDGYCIGIELLYPDFPPVYLGGNNG